MKRIDLLALASGTLLLIGLGLPAIARQNQKSNRAKSINNLKQVGLAFHNYHDAMASFPHNGGANTEGDLANVNYGWHSPNTRDSGTWATLILPYLEQDTLFKDCVFKGVAPPKLPEYPDDKLWKAEVKTYLCAERGRAGFSTSRENGGFPGPVTDYAVNAFLNSPPQLYGGPGNDGFARGEVKPGTNGDWAAANRKASFAGITDGTSNTIMLGQKALPGTRKAEAPKNSPEESDCAPVPKDNDASGSGDEGIFSPGNWAIKDGVKTLTSTGTARGHVVVKSPPAQDVKEYPKDGGVPWMYEDSELAGATPPPYLTAWGGPFKEGVLFMFCDGSVHTLKYTMKGTVNFARILYPADGNVVTLD